MINKPVIGVAAAVVVVAAGTWYYLQSRHAALPRAPVSAPAPPPAEPSAEPAIQHPLPAGQDSASKAPLPSLADSDAALSDALGQLVGATAVKDYLLPENIVRHLVVTIDNLPRQKVAVAKRPTSASAGSFVANGDELHTTNLRSDGLFPVAAHVREETMEDAPWPATKDELIDYSIRSGAPIEVVENLQELEDEGEIYEGLEDIWPDYPSQEDFFFNEDEY